MIRAVAQGLARLVRDQKVAGSIPACPIWKSCSNSLNRKELLHDFLLASPKQNQLNERHLYAMNDNFSICSIGFKMIFFENLE